MFGVVGGKVDLPCNTSSPHPQHYPMLVMWFKDNNLNPFYRLVEIIHVYMNLRYHVAI